MLWGTILRVKTSFKKSIKYRLDNTLRLHRFKVVTPSYKLVYETNYCDNHWNPTNLGMEPTLLTMKHHLVSNIRKAVENLWTLSYISGVFSFLIDIFLDNHILFESIPKSDQSLLKINREEKLKIHRCFHRFSKMDHIVILSQSSVRWRIWRELKIVYYIHLYTVF